MSTTITFKGREPIGCIAVLSDTALVTSADDLLKQLPRPKIEIQFDASTDVNTLLSVYSDSDALSEISINTEIPVGTKQITRPATEEEIAAMEAEKTADAESDSTSDNITEENTNTDETSTEDESNFSEDTENIYMQYALSDDKGNIIKDLDKRLFAVSAINGLIKYIEETQKTKLEHINKITIYTITKY